MNQGVTEFNPDQFDVTAEGIFDSLLSYLADKLEIPKEGRPLVKAILELPNNVPIEVVAIVDTRKQILAAVTDPGERGKRAVLMQIAATNSSGKTELSKNVLPDSDFPTDINDIASYFVKKLRPMDIPELFGTLSSSKGLDEKRHIVKQILTRLGLSESKMHVSGKAVYNGSMRRVNLTFTPGFCVGFQSDDLSFQGNLTLNGRASLVGSVPRVNPNQVFSKIFDSFTADTDTD